jgi:hypothetical protein
MGSGHEKSTLTKYEYDMETHMRATRNDTGSVTGLQGKGNQGEGLDILSLASRP